MSGLTVRPHAGVGAVLVTVVGAAVLAGCAGVSPGSSPATTARASSPAGTPTASGTIAGETDGARVFRAQCAGCHGTKGEGNLGPPLDGIAQRLSVAEQTALVEQGRGRMPAFRPALSDAEIAAVVAYTRTNLG